MQDAKSSSLYSPVSILTLKSKSRDGGLSRFEWERTIPLGVAERLLARCSGVVDKVRHIVEYEGHTFEVDELYFQNEGLTVAEVELNDINEPFPRPEWLGEEVTGDPRYYNSSLARNPFCNW